MAITRAQMARQLEPGLGSSDKRKFYKEKKSGRKNPLAKTFTV